MLPLVAGLENLTLPGTARAEAEPARLEVASLPPGPMAALMEAGDLDVGMVPVGALMNHPEWKIVGRSMIGSNGPVLSVLLLGAGEPESWKVLHLDSHSRTSNLLAQVILQKRFGIRPELGETIPLENWMLPEQLPAGEAFVVIGTHALVCRDKWNDDGKGDGTTVLDLGELWTGWTGSPFAYAVWAARAGISVDAWMEEFEKLKVRNLDRLEAIIAEQSDLAESGLNPAQAKSYLTQNITFDFDDQAKRGLERFHREVRELDLIPPGWTLSGSLSGEPKGAAAR